MCLGAIRPMLNPDPKLAKMISFAKIILLINVLTAFLRLFKGMNASDMIYDLICAMFLALSMFSIYFVYMAIYVMFALFNTFYLLVSVALRVQIIVQQQKATSVDIVALSLSIFLFVFYLFALIFTFPMYKEMKAQMVGLISAGDGGNNSGASRVQQDSSERANSNDNDQGGNNAGFRAFSGRGVAVGGATV
jgi:hypothetical protein